MARRRVGALIEQPGLYPDLSGRENLRLYAALLGLDSPARQVEEISKTVGLSPGEKKPVRHYSMGMKQRLGVALALLGGPDLLLLDEPINGLDPEGIRGNAGASAAAEPGAGPDHPGQLPHSG